MPTIRVAYMRHISPTACCPAARFRYAVTSFKGCLQQLTLAWIDRLRDWLPASGMQLDGRPPFEHMPPDTCHAPAIGVFHCEPCTPVKPR